MNHSALNRLSLSPIRNRQQNSYSLMDDNNNLASKSSSQEDEVLDFQYATGSSSTPNSLTSNQKDCNDAFALEEFDKSTPKASNFSNLQNDNSNVSLNNRTISNDGIRKLNAPKNIDRPNDTDVWNITDQRVVVVDMNAFPGLSDHSANKSNRQNLSNTADQDSYIDGQSLLSGSLYTDGAGSHEEDGVKNQHLSQNHTYLTGISNQGNSVGYQNQNWLEMRSSSDSAKSLEDSGDPVQLQIIDKHMEVMTTRRKADLQIRRDSEDVHSLQSTEYNAIHREPSETGDDETDCPDTVLSSSRRNNGIDTGTTKPICSTNRKTHSIERNTSFERQLDSSDEDEISNFHPDRISSRSKNHSNMSDHNPTIVSDFDEHFLQLDINTTMNSTSVISSDNEAASIVTGDLYEGSSGSHAGEDIPLQRIRQVGQSPLASSSSDTEGGDEEIVRDSEVQALQTRFDTVAAKAASQSSKAAAAISVSLKGSKSAATTVENQHHKSLSFSMKETNLEPPLEHSNIITQDNFSEGSPENPSHEMIKKYNSHDNSSSSSCQCMRENAGAFIGAILVVAAIVLIIIFLLLLVVTESDAFSQQITSATSLTLERTMGHVRMGTDTLVT